MAEPFTPADEHLIDDVETLKIISDAFRLKILEAMGEPTTVKQVAEQLGTSPKKLYYHVNLMEKHGLIVVVDEQIVSGIIEKWYQVRAFSFRVKKSILNVSQDKEEDIRRLLSSIFENTVQDVVAASRAGMLPMADHADGESMLLTRSRYSFTREQFEVFKERFQQLFEEMKAADEEAGDAGRPFALTLAFYPTASAKSAPADEDG